MDIQTNWYAKFKYFSKNYLIPPGLWSKLSFFFNVSISKKTKFNKINSQYPYSWNGQNFTPKEDSLYFEKNLQFSKTCVTRDFETKCIQIKRDKQSDFQTLKSLMN